MIRFLLFLNHIRGADEAEDFVLRRHWFDDLSEWLNGG